jgi:hypothetical protein
LYIGLEAGWVSELVWTQRLEEKFFACVADRNPDVQSVVRHYMTELPQLVYDLYAEEISHLVPMFY